MLDTYTLEILRQAAVKAEDLTEPVYVFCANDQEAEECLVFLNGYAPGLNAEIQKVTLESPTGAHQVPVVRIDYD